MDVGRSEVVAIHLAVFPLCSWIGYLPEGQYTFKAEAQGYRDEILKYGGPEALAEWMQLEVSDFGSLERSSFSNA